MARKKRTRNRKAETRFVGSTLSRLSLLDSEAFRGKGQAMSDEEDLVI